MSYDLYFLAQKEAPTLEAMSEWLACYPGVLVADHGATYESTDTGVYFSFLFLKGAGQTRSGRPRLPISFHLNYFRPPGFAREAALLLEAFTSHFNLHVVDEQPLGIGEGEFQPGLFLRAWRQANREAHRSYAERAGASSIPHLDNWTLEHSWQWNHQRSRLHDWLQTTENAVCTTPLVIATRDPSGRKRACSAVVWDSFNPIVLPEVDLLIFSGVRTDGHAWAPFSEIASVLEHYTMHAPAEHFSVDGHSYTFGLRNWLLTDTTREELRRTIMSRLRFGTPESVPWDHIAISEWVGEALILPALRRTAQGAPVEGLKIGWFTTSAHHTTSTIIHGSGEIVRGDVLQPSSQHARLGRARLTELSILAQEIVDSKFPDLEKPKSAPTPPTVPPVRLMVSLHEHSLTVEFAATELTAMPAIERIRKHFNAMVTEAERRGSETTLRNPTPIPAPLMPLDQALRTCSEDPIARETVRAFNGYRILTQSGPAAEVPLTMPDSAGHPFGVVLTSQEALAALFTAFPYLNKTCRVDVVPGSVVFSSTNVREFSGLLVNPYGPGLSVVLNAETCKAIAALSRSLQPPPQKALSRYDRLSDRPFVGPTIEALARFFTKLTRTNHLSQNNGWTKNFAQFSMQMFQNCQANIKPDQIG